MAVVSSCREVYGQVRQRAQPLLYVVSLIWNCPGNREEGGDDVKSVLPLCLGLHTCGNGVYKGSQTRKGELIPQSTSQFGLGSATRPHEVELLVIVGQLYHGEYVLGHCTHRPSVQESWNDPKSEVYLGLR